MLFLRDVHVHSCCYPSADKHVLYFWLQPTLQAFVESPARLNQPTVLVEISVIIMSKTLRRPAASRPKVSRSSKKAATALVAKMSTPSIKKSQKLIKTKPACSKPKHLVVAAAVVAAAVVAAAVVAIIVVAVVVAAIVVDSSCPSCK